MYCLRRKDIDIEKVETGMKVIIKPKNKTTFHLEEIDRNMEYYDMLNLRHKLYAEAIEAGMIPIKLGDLI
jgi:hypothetical protein